MSNSRQKPGQKITEVFLTFLTAPAPTKSMLVQCHLETLKGIKEWQTCLSKTELMSSGILN